MEVAKAISPPPGGVIFEVGTAGDDYKAVDYGRLTAVLIEAVKELKVENDLLKARLDELEAFKP